MVNGWGKKKMMKRKPTRENWKNAFFKGIRVESKKRERVKKKEG